MELKLNSVDSIKTEIWIPQENISKEKKQEAVSTTTVIVVAYLQEEGQDQDRIHKI